MTVVIDTRTVSSDVTSAQAVTRAGLWALSGFDGLLLPQESADSVVRWVRCNTGRPSVGATVVVGTNMAALHRLDGVRVDRDTAVGVVRIVEKAVSPARCHLNVTFRGHDSLPYSASFEAAVAFAECVAGRVDVEIDGPAHAEDPALPYERLWL